MHVLVYVYIYACRYACMYACRYACMYGYVQVDMHVLVYVLNPVFTRAVSIMHEACRDLCACTTAIPIIIEGQLQDFQRFSSSKLVL